MYQLSAGTKASWQMRNRCSVTGRALNGSWLPHGSGTAMAWSLRVKGSPQGHTTHTYTSSRATPAVSLGGLTNRPPPSTIRPSPSRQAR